MATPKLADRVNIVAPELLAMPVSKLPLSVRPANCLKNDNIQTVGELLQKSEAELLRTPNFGRKSLKEITEVLNDLGLGLLPRGEPDLVVVPEHWITEQTITATFWFCPDNHAHESRESAKDCAARHAHKSRAKALAEARQRAIEKAHRLAMEKRQRERAEFKARFAASEISKSELDVRVAEALFDVGVGSRADFREKFVKDNAFDLKALAYVPTLWVQDYPDILRWLNAEHAALA